MEFNRLTNAEAERMTDFRSLLNQADLKDCSRSALRRKIDVFTACGRIPTEDYEVYMPQEWLAALWMRELRPRRHEKLAERMPESDLLNWIAALHTRVQSILPNGAAR